MKVEIEKGKLILICDNTHNFARMCSQKDVNIVLNDKRKFGLNLNKQKLHFQ